MRTTSSEPKLDDWDVVRLVSDIKQRVAQDGELQPWVVNASPGRVFARSIFLQIVLDGRRWSEVNRSQQDRLIRKLGGVVRDAYASLEPGGQRQVNAMLRDDTGEMGVIVVLRSNVSYNGRR